MRALTVLRRRDFRMVFAAASVSLIGDGISPLAVTFAILDLTGSATDLGLVLAVRTVGLVGSLLVGGVVGDRVNRRSVMIAADLTRLISQATIGVLLVTGHTDVLELAVSQGLLGAATGFFNPASSGLMPLVAGDFLQQANSLRGVVSAIGSVAGPAIGGVLVAATDPGIALIADAGTYAISALLLARVRGGGAPATRSDRSFLAELREGFEEVRARTWLWSSLLALSVVNACGVAFVVLGALIAQHQLGGAGAWATVLVAEGVGAILAAAVLLRREFSRPLMAAAIIGVLPVVPTFLIAIPAPLAVLALAAVGGGIGQMSFNTLWETTLQRHIPERARSRVSSYDWFGSLVLQTAAYAVIGPFSSAIGVSSALEACAALELLMTLSLLAIPAVRTLPRFPPQTGGQRR